MSDIGFGTVLVLPLSSTMYFSFSVEYFAPYIGYEQQYLNITQNHRYSRYNPPPHHLKKRKIIPQVCPCQVAGTRGQTGSMAGGRYHTLSQVQSCLTFMILNVGVKVRNEGWDKTNRHVKILKSRMGLALEVQKGQNSGAVSSPCILAMVKVHASIQARGSN